jgi:fatty acid synthase subunit beta
LSLLEVVSKFLSFASSVDSSKDTCDFEILRSAFTEFEDRFLSDSDIHALAATFQGSPKKSEEIIRSYYAARAVNFNLDDASRCPSALLRAVGSGRASVYAIFGGQGNTENYFEELRHVCHVYRPLVDDFIAKSAETLLAVSRTAKARHLILSTIDVRKWLHWPDTTPKASLMISSSLSFPLIGLLQLSHFVITCKVLGRTPGEVREYISGTTGHSQGVVSAAVIASADSWDSSHNLANMALITLFWIGCRSQRAYPQTVLPPDIVEDSVSNGEGIPTPMLSVRDLAKDQLQKHIDNINKNLAADEQIAISLVNTPRNIVIAGPPMSLYGLNVQLRQVKAPQGQDQSKTLYSRRSLAFSSSFLPITAPFHSKYLVDSTDQICRDALAENIEFPAEA